MGNATAYDREKQQCYQIVNLLDKGNSETSFMRNDKAGEETSEDRMNAYDMSEGFTDHLD